VIAGNEMEVTLIPYYLAQLALGVNLRVYQYFAIDTLYMMLADAETARLLYAKHGFSYQSFNKLTGQYDLFNFFPKWVRICGYSLLGTKLKLIIRKFPIIKRFIKRIVKFY
jgi:hypothetical protein